MSYEVILKSLECETSFSGIFKHKNHTFIWEAFLSKLQ